MAAIFQSVENKIIMVHSNVTDFYFVGVKGASRLSPAACRLFSRGVILARSRFACSTIPEEKWGTNRSLKS